MKLKKIIASLTAAAMAVTTMAFAPLSVSAATENNVVVASDVFVLAACMCAPCPRYRNSQGV